MKKINMTKHFVRKMYKLNHMVRYNPHPKVKEETVAAHSFYVTLFVMKICDQLSLDDSIQLSAIQRALVHDTPESVINDITHDAKESITGLSELILPYELDFIDRNFNVKAHPTESNLVNLIVDFADVLSVYQYVDNELNLGNSFIKEIYDHTIIRLENFKQQFKEVGICLETIH
jgi:5'-deoxynucleotidase YfbR-like HD superfamily hydrolase